MGAAPVVDPGAGAAWPSTRPAWIVLLIALSVATLWLARRVGFFRLAGGAGRREPDEESMPWAMWLVAGAAVLLGQSVGSVVARGMASGHIGAWDSLAGLSVVSWGGYLGAIAAAGAAVVLIPALRRSVGIVPSPRDGATGVVWFVLALPTVLLVGQAAFFGAALWARWRGGGPPETTAHSTLRLLAEGPSAGGVWWWALVGAVTIGAPIVEEVVYRGMLQTALRRAMGGAWRAVVASSLVFTVMHAGVAEPHALVTLLVLSLAFGAAYERTRRLWVPITMHALFNAANIAGAVLL